MSTSQATGHQDTTSRLPEGEAEPPNVARPTGPLLTERQLAERWQVHPGSLANQRCRGRNVVDYIKLMGSRVRYPLIWVEEYEARLIAEAEAEAEAEAAAEAAA